MSAEPKKLTIITYNVHSCRGTDGKVDPIRIAEVVARYEPEIVALQELDVGRARTGGADQAHMIAAHLSMKRHFHPALHVAEEQYGDAILTALPSRLVKAGPLPSIGEPRGALWVAVECGGRRVNVVNTHLGLRRRERIAQVAALTGPAWLGQPEARREPFIVAGDFNAVPASPAYRNLVRHARDVQRETEVRPKATFPSRLPLLRIDHIFISDGIEPATSLVPSDMLTRVASDHLPLVCEVRLA